MPPYLRFHVADRLGQLVLSKEITIPRATMMHDFAITEHHVVFLDLPVVFDLSTFGKRPFPAQWKPEAGARIGVMPRDASTEPRWFEIEPCYVFHTVNAYDEGDTVVLDVVRHEQMFTADPYGIADGTGTLERWTIDVRQGRVRARTTRRPNARVPARGPAHRGSPASVCVYREGAPRGLPRSLRHVAPARPEGGHEQRREARTGEAGR